MYKRIAYNIRKTEEYPSAMKDYLINQIQKHIFLLESGGVKSGC